MIGLLTPRSPADFHHTDIGKEKADPVSRVCQKEPY